jgi:hypothetical protein
MSKRFRMHPLKALELCDRPRETDARRSPHRNCRHTRMRKARLGKDRRKDGAALKGAGHRLLVVGLLEKRALPRPVPMVSTPQCA